MLVSFWHLSFYNTMGGIFWVTSYLLMGWMDGGRNRWMDGKHDIPSSVTWGGWQRCVTRAPSRCHSLISEWCVRAGSRRRDSAGPDEGCENTQRTHRLRPQRRHWQSRTCRSADSVTHSCGCSGQWDLRRLMLIFQELVGPLVMHNNNYHVFSLFVCFFLWYNTAIP